MKTRHFRGNLRIRSGRGREMRRILDRLYLHLILDFPWRLTGELNLTATTDEGVIIRPPAKPTEEDRELARKEVAKLTSDPHPTQQSVEGGHFLSGLSKLPITAFLLLALAAPGMAQTTPAFSLRLGAVC